MLYPLSTIPHLCPGARVRVPCCCRWCVPVRYLTNLHAQGCDPSLNPFELPTLTRVFWSSYCVERNTAQLCGVPYLLRDSELSISLPQSFDDHLLGTTAQLPLDISRVSSLPHLNYTVKWTRLSSEIRDKLFCIHAQQPVATDFIISIDARIPHLSRILPDQLQWSRESAQASQDDSRPPWLMQQALVLHLINSASYNTHVVKHADVSQKRTNHLGLQLRREEILSPESRAVVVPEYLKLAEDTLHVVHDFYF